MTLNEILKAKGMSDEDIAVILNDMKQNKIFTASEENLDIRYKKLKDEHDALAEQHTQSTNLIEQMKADVKGNEALQGRIATYESTIATLQDQLKQTQVDSAIKVALLGAKATDVEYMTFKLKEKGEIELDEQGNIKGIDDKLAGLKTQFPTQFESKTEQRELQVHTLHDRQQNDGATVTKEDFKKMGYDSRVKLKESDPELYAKLKD